MRVRSIQKAEFDATVGVLKRRKDRADWIASLLVAIVIGGPSLMIATGWIGHPDFAVPLPNGFELQRANSRTIAIWAPQSASPPPPGQPSHRVKVAARIASLDVAGDMVIGLVVPSPESELSSMELPGYFLLDTATGWLESGLERIEFERRCRCLGIDPLGLRPPRHRMRFTRR